jgi:cysteine desulfurase/selenocysteine lyase
LEAGTPNIAGGIVLGTAVDYMELSRFWQHTTTRAWVTRIWDKTLTRNWGLRIFGTAKEKTSVISFNIEGIHPYDIGTIIDKLGIAVRTGHHCAISIMTYFIMTFQDNSASFFSLQH